jgi:chromosome segregation ATPase
MKHVSKALVAFAVVALGFAGSGCSSGYKAGSQTSESIMTAAQKLEDGRVQIDKVTVSLDKLANASAGSDLRPLFKDYSANVDKLDSIAKDLKKRADEMRAKGQAYFKEWDKEIADIHNEDIKSRSTQRRAEVEQAFQRINDKSQTLKNEYQPLMSDLQDIRTALNNDLTPGGIATIKPIAERVRSEAISVKDAAGAVADEYKALGVRMSPSGK